MMNPLWKGIEMVGLHETLPSIVGTDSEKWSRLERLQILLSVSGIVGLLKYLENVSEALEPEGSGPQTKDEIFNMIHSVYEVESLSTSALEAGFQELPMQIPNQIFQHDFNSGLSGREIEVLQLMAQGAANKEIATTLSIGHCTVKTHVTHIFEKLEVNKRTEAVTEALRRGIITLQRQEVLGEKPIKS